MNNEFKLINVGNIIYMIPESLLFMYNCNIEKKEFVNYSLVNCYRYQLKEEYFEIYDSILRIQNRMNAIIRTIPINKIPYMTAACWVGGQSIEEYYGNNHE